MNANSATDVEDRSSTDKMKGYLKTNLGLIIALGLSLIAVIVFMILFVIFHNQNSWKLTENEKVNKKFLELTYKLEGLNKNVNSMVALGQQLFDVSLPDIEGIESAVYKRKMEYSSGLEKATNTFKVMQFNILSDAFCGLYDDPSIASENNKFTEAMKPANQHYLYFRFRLPLIIDEIRKHKIDIVTIQANDHYKEVEEALNLNKENEWKCFHKNNVSNLIKNMTYKPKNDENDGNTICWRTEKFVLGDVSDAVGEEFKVGDEKNDQVFVYVKLQQIATQKDVIVFTTELYGKKDLNGERIRLDQTKELMKTMKNLKDKNPNATLVLSADLNASPFVKEEKLSINKQQMDEESYPLTYPAATYSYISENKMPNFQVQENQFEFNIDVDADAKTKYMNDMKNIVTKMLELNDDDKNIKNDLDLKSSQKMLNNNGELEFTVNAQLDGKDGKSKTVRETEDYIFYTGKVTPIAHLPLTDENDTLPRYNYPSNHIAIVTEFLWDN